MQLKTFIYVLSTQHVSATGGISCISDGHYFMFYIYFIITVHLLGERSRLIAVRVT
jgi:hypothetical protein